jgi:hypothetical protein
MRALLAGLLFLCSAPLAQAQLVLPPAQGANSIALGQLPTLPTVSFWCNPTGSTANAQNCVFGGTFAWGGSGNQLRTVAGTGEVTWAANSFATSIARATNFTWTGTHIFTVPIQERTYLFSTPATGETVTIADTQDTAVIAPAGALAALTITLPTCSSTYDGKKAKFSSTQAITTLTVNATAGTVADAPTTLGLGNGNEYLCRGSDTTWYRML